MLNDIRKILIIHPGGIGDLIMFTPVIKVLKNNFPEAKIDIFAGYTPECAGVFEERGIINKFFNINFVKSNLIDKLKFIFQLRKEKYDLSLFPIDANNFKGSIISFLIGAKIRVGGKGGLFYTHLADLKEKRHKTEDGISLLKAIGLNINYETPAPFMDFESEKEFANKFLVKNNLENKVLISIRPNYDKYQKFKGFKRWPKEYFIELGQKILRDFPNIYILLLGGPEEKEVCQEIKNKLDKKDRVKIAAGISIGKEAALVNECVVFVTSDSGPAHFNSTTKADSIILFGPTDYRITGPRGPKVHIIEEKCNSPHDIDDRKFRRNDRSEPCECLRKITPDMVLNKIKEILQNG